jgi:hypothetical protein
VAPTTAAGVDRDPHARRIGMTFSAKSRLDSRIIAMSMPG